MHDASVIGHWRMLARNQLGVDGPYCLIVSVPSDGILSQVVVLSRISFPNHL